MPASMPTVTPALSPGVALGAGAAIGELLEEGWEWVMGEDGIMTQKKKKKRRRRRRLLTPTDLGDLAQLQALVGKGEVMKVAVMKALSRR